MIKINIKPMSVNEAWQGKRFKTKRYKEYERECMFRLPKKIDIPDGNLKVSLLFGFSSKLADADNPVKCFIDVLQKKYGFNDNRIYEYSIKKIDVKKGEEFIEFYIEKKAKKSLDN
jgi:Holliday junction resolvase RusA-like endonuclease